MSDGPCTFYSYLPATDVGAPDWPHDGNQNPFYENVDAVRRAVRQLKREVAKDPEHSWKPIHLVKIEISAVSRHSVLVLLNEGISSLVKNYEILERIDDNG
ncbi:hypothetical protein CFBP4996_25805 (plasmid) [Agrobacterium leguminum]|uniref:Uncharacterized protein n=1 Tax=Agrobacterium deltaense NCPPB 1641 TaxID=1183425 RepID=A0A1S7UCW3_9HYPH|nr:MULTISPECIES: hypothetical protein [Agrobacterium]WFS69500.1 hypothetical protein CFBP4996_25805 [Agrobacterium leguminum]CVI64411.1 conserved hypothetical protein [Agrobacterium deltaense NCPPB 1641]